MVNPVEFLTWLGNQLTLERIRSALTPGEIKLKSGRASKPKKPTEPPSVRETPTPPTSGKSGESDKVLSESKLRSIVREEVHDKNVDRPPDPPENRTMPS